MSQASTTGTPQTTTGRSGEVAKLAKPRRSKRSKRRIAIYVTMVVMIAIVSWWANTPRSIVLRFLRSKYGQEFVLKESGPPGQLFDWRWVRFSSYCPECSGHLEAFVAYPKSNPKARFSAQYYDGKPSDSYVAYLWQEEEIKRLKPVVEGIFGMETKIALDFNTTGFRCGETMEEIQKNERNLSLEEAIAKYGDKICYHLWIKDVHDNMTEQDKEKAVAMLRKLAKSLPNNADIIYVSKMLIKDEVYRHPRCYGLTTSPEGMNESTTSELVNNFREFSGNSPSIVATLEGDDPHYFAPSADDWR